ncbi:MAG: hypothetical protein LH649_16420 [Pseudanabaena sp. CAN_BIN31]|nr:hypothetical protein [Pseudanabaena sp. CAN_BIN31]
MTQTIEQKITLYDRDLNLWLEEAIAKSSGDCLVIATAFQFRSWLLVV